MSSAKKKGIIGLIVMVILSGIIIYGSEPLYNAIDKWEKEKQLLSEENEGPEFIDGSYYAETDFDEKGYKETVSMTVKDGKITEIIWDSLNKDGVGKTQLSLDGQYIMTESGLTWAEQSKLISEYVIARQSANGLNLDENGKIDTIAGVSIDISSFMKLVEQLVQQASGEEVIQKSGLTDGSYYAETDFDEKGYKETVSMTVKDGEITEIIWDSLNKDGVGKTQLSLDGQYIMTESGLPWAEQSKLISEYVIAQQSANGLNLDENGKIDTIAGVSIDISSFMKLVDQLIQQASGEEVIQKSGLTDGSYYAETDFDEKGYKETVSMTVKDGKITEITWDSLNKDGVGKTQLSLDGQYIMTESGLPWAEQSKLISEYVIAQQSANGLNLDENGKIDTIAGVSIDISSFMKLVDQLVQQASGEEVFQKSDLNDGTYYAETDFDEKGYKETVSMTVKDGKITEIIWDSLNKDGVGKTQLSLDGQYIMTESGLPWAEQSKLISEYVIARQSANGLNLDENGKIDTIAGVSIDISSFMKLVDQLVQQASGEEVFQKSDLNDGTYYAETDFDEKGYKETVSMTVKDGKITEIIWDSLNKDGVGKTQLSLDGQYIMTESGLPWAEQSKLISEYVIAQQSANGLNLDENGKIDTIAGVSIDISGFTQLLEENISKASK